MGNSRIRMAAALAIPTLFLAACGGQDDSGTDAGASDGAAASGEVRVDGSSTVGSADGRSRRAVQGHPEGSGINVSVGQSGTGGGFQKFCAGETDISDASRPIKDEEAAVCAAAGSSTPRSPWPTTP